uniref:Uncharacterized protein n=1 Tax=Sciurus vulgaris TaxID=55149 RepID=A0A8D2DDB6_SCIVU
MATLSNLTFSGKVLTNPNNGGKLAFLDMSLDDIIILKKIETTCVEEKKDKRQNNKKTATSKRRSNARKHRKQRGEVQ